MDLTEVKGHLEQLWRGAVARIRRRWPVTEGAGAAAKHSAPRILLLLDRVTAVEASIRSTSCTPSGARSRRNGTTRRRSSSRSVGVWHFSN